MAIIFLSLWSFESQTSDYQKNARLLWLFASRQIADGNRHQAEKTFISLLEKSPDFIPSLEESPVITEAFLHAKKKYFAAVLEVIKPSIKSVFNEQGHYHITICFTHEIAPLITSIRLHTRTAWQTTYLHQNLQELTKEDSCFSFTPELPVYHDEIFYFIECIGRFDAPFYSFGSSQNPLLLKSRKPNLIRGALKNSGATVQLKNSWPIFLGIAIALAGTFTYGVMQIN